MGQKQELVLVDTNVFVIDLRYKRDPHYKTNLTFLKFIAEKRTGFTTLINLLELCGILSFNLNHRQLAELWFYFQDRYQVSVLPVPDLEAPFPQIGLKEIFDLFKKRASLGDALMVAVANRYLPFVSTLVTWNKPHLQAIFPKTVLTPEEFLEASKDF